MRKVLFIEDDNVLRENTSELLELADYEVITAANGKIGVDLAKKTHPDIVVCDIMMPEMDGYEVLRQLSEKPATQNIPFIFLSAKTEHKDIRKGMNLGADDYLTKPFEEEELIGAIESRLAKVAILKNMESAPKEEEQKINSLNDLRDFMKSFDLQTYKSGENVYEEGKQNNQFFLVEHGVVKGHRMDETGKELITSIYKDEDFFGNASFNKASVYEETATAMEETKVYAVPKEELREVMMKNSRITLDYIDALGDNLEGAKEQLLEMAYGSVRKKTANTILMFSQKIRKFPTHSIRISRSDLASVAGMAPESLIRTLSDFKKEGLIEIEGRNIKILDAEGLRRIA
ncbi:MAG TPA: response regulator [Flavobacteriaceae bacterium]|nr:response regulator [Flavobacteriaceae bacterium]